MPGSRPGMTVCGRARRCFGAARGTALAEEPSLGPGSARHVVPLVRDTGAVRFPDKPRLARRRSGTQGPRRRRRYVGQAAGRALGGAAGPGSGGVAVALGPARRAVAPSPRHGRAWPGHPRPWLVPEEVVDARLKAGHDGVRAGTTMFWLACGMASAEGSPLGPGSARHVDRWSGTRVLFVSRTSRALRGADPGPRSRAGDGRSWMPGPGPGLTRPSTSLAHARGCHGCPGRTRA